TKIPTFSVTHHRVSCAWSGSGGVGEGMRAGASPWRLLFNCRGTSDIASPACPAACSVSSRPAWARTLPRSRSPRLPAGIAHCNNGMPPASPAAAFPETRSILRRSLPHLLPSLPARLVDGGVDARDADMGLAPRVHDAETPSVVV